MRDFLLGLGALSLGGAVAIALALALGRGLGRRYAARWRCLVWLLLCLRLAAPVVWVPAREGAAVALPPAEDRLLWVRRETGRVQAPSAPVERGEGPAAAPAPAPERAQRPAGVSLFQALFGLWLAGALGVLVWHLWGHWSFCRWVRRWGRPAEGEILERYEEIGRALGLKRLPELVRVPEGAGAMLVGLVRPRVLLPREMGAEALGWALGHELWHYKRRDLWRKALALWVCAIHWFDPLVWKMAREMDRDGELACDDALAAELPPPAREEYARTILAAAGQGGREE